jgi:hypothetical protein
MQQEVCDLAVGGTNVIWSYNRCVSTTFVDLEDEEFLFGVAWYALRTSVFCYKSRESGAHRESKNPTFQESTFRIQNWTDRFWCYN